MATVSVSVFFWQNTVSGNIRNMSIIILFILFVLPTNLQFRQNTTNLDFGRLFKVNNVIDLSIIFNTKVSSLILGKGANKQKTNTHDGVLFVKTLNINLSFKL